MKKGIAALVCVFLAVMIQAQADDGETVYIRIGEQYFATRMPETADELKALVRQMSETEMKLNDEYLGYKTENENLQREYLARIEGQAKDIEKLSEDAGKLNATLEDLNKAKADLESTIGSLEIEMNRLRKAKRTLAVGLEGGYSLLNGRISGDVIIPLNLFNAVLLAPKLGVEYDVKKPGVDFVLGFQFSVWTR